MYDTGVTYTVILNIPFLLYIPPPPLPPLSPPCAADPKSSPTGLFCLVVGQVNSNMHLIEKLYRDTVVPCIRYMLCVHMYTDVQST